MTHTSVPPQTNHTPGPWSISFQTTGERQLWQCADIGNRDKGAHIVSVEWAGPDYGGTLKTIGEAHANAHLIAAAPELLEALNNLEHMVRGDYDNNPYAQEVIRNARAAIAKAKGTS